MRAGVGAFSWVLRANDEGWRIGRSLAGVGMARSWGGQRGFRLFLDSQVAVCRGA